MTTTPFGALAAALCLGMIAGTALAHEREDMALQRIVGEDVGPNDNFGVSLDADDDTILVGASFSNEGFGAAYVFVRRPHGRWIQQAKLTATDGVAGDLFGTAVAISGNTAVVTSRANGSTPATAHVFHRFGHRWLREARLEFEATQVIGVDIDGRRLAIGDQLSGVHVFRRRAPGRWVEEALIAPAGSGIVFTGAISVSNGRVAFSGGESAFGGSAFVFVRRPGVGWIQEARIAAPVDPIDFASSISLAGRKLLVGAAGERDFTGAAYVFARSRQGWDLSAQLLAETELNFRCFGLGVALQGRTAVVGAPCTRRGEPEELALIATEIFVRTEPGTWARVASMRVPIESFGSSVALADGFAIAASPGDPGGGAIYVQRCRSCQSHR